MILTRHPLFRILSFFFFGLSCFFFVSSAYAILELELTQGVDSRIPVGISRFSGTSDSLTPIIAQDLSHSGYFKIFDDLPASPRPGDTLNLSAFKARDIDNLLIGQLGGGQVKFELVDVLGKKPLLKQKYQFVASDARRLAHHISDVVYEKLTGVRGIFSTRIAYVVVKRYGGGKVRYSLEIADADGFNPRPVLVSSQPIMSPNWSPDGRKIAYVSFENRQSEIYIADVATGARRLISQAPGINGAPAFSPDGRRLAMVLSKTGKPKIYVADIAGGQVRQVTTGYAIDTEPSWSPDGHSIIFTSDRGGNPQIYQLNLGTHNIQRVTYQGDYNARASFTPDGKQIALLHRESGIFTIAVYDRKSERIQILSRQSLDESPSISPNGKMVLFATRDNGRGVLGVASTDGRVQLRLPAREGDVQEPAWSPFLS